MVLWSCDVVDLWMCVVWRGGVVYLLDCGFVEL